MTTETETLRRFLADWRRMTPEHRLLALAAIEQAELPVAGEAQWPAGVWRPLA